MALPAASAQRPIAVQQQVFPDGGRNVQRADSCATSGPEVATQSAAADVLQGARPGATLAQQPEERLLLLRGRKEGRKGGRSSGLEQDSGEGAETNLGQVRRKGAPPVTGGQRLVGVQHHLQGGDGREAPPQRLKPQKLPLTLLQLMLLTNLGAPGGGGGATTKGAFPIATTTSPQARLRCSS